MNIRFELCLLVLLAIPGTGYGQRDQTAQFDSLLTGAKEAQARGDYAGAADAYKKAVKLRADIPELWANLGIMQDAIGHYPDAVESFHKAILLKPSLYVPNLFLGIEYTRMHRAAEAIPFLIKAEELNPHDSRASLSLGRAYLSTRDFPAAAKALRHAIALDEKNSQAWFSLGVAASDEVEAEGWKISGEGANSAEAKALFAESLQEQSRFKEAVTQAQAVLAADPAFPCAHSQLGFLYIAQRQDSDALREFAAESPSCSLASLGRVRLHVDGAEDEQALEALQALWKRDPGFVRSHISSLTDGLSPERSAAFSLFLDRQKEAASLDAGLYESLSAAFRGAPQPVKESAAPVSQMPGSIRAAESAAGEGRYGRCAAELAGGMEKQSNRGLLLLARCAFMTGDYEIAAAASDLLTSRSPHDMAGLYWSVKASEELAFAAFDRYEQLEPNSEKTHLLLGDMYRQRQRFQQAENEYKTASALAPQDVAPMFGLASAYSQDSKTDQALELARKALAMSPNDPDLNVLVGEILISHNEWAAAVDYLQRGLGAKPQILPHVHALLGQAYEHTGRTQEAISELRLGVASDVDGSVYYQLARTYTSIGDKAAAQEAFQHMKVLQQKRREHAVIAVEDSSDVMQNDIP